MFGLFSTRRQPGWIAILPQGATLTLAHVLRTPNSLPELLRLDSFAVERGEADVLARLCIARGLRSFACTTLMGDGDYSVTPLDAPSVPLDERKEALRWALKEMVNYPVDSACIEVLEIPRAGQPAGRAAGVLVVSATEQAVRARVAPFEAAKIRLAAVDIPELAQRNVAALFEDNHRGLALLRVDERGMMLTLSFCGELIAVRRGEMSTLQLNGGNDETRARVRERLILELQRSLDNFDRQYSHIPISKVVLACYPQANGLLAALAESSYVPVHEMDLASALDFAAVPDFSDRQFQAKNLLAIGAALRSEEAAA